MENDRKLMQFYFLTSPEKSTHYHQNLEILYVLKGEMEIQIDDALYILKNGDFIVVNANKSHAITVTREMFGARFEIDFHLLAEYMGTMQLMFWCNTAADKNDAYQDMRVLLDRILERYFEKEDKGSLHLQSLYFETLHLLTSNFMVKADDVRINLENSQDRVRVRQIQNYIQANYQGQISLNDLAEKLYLSNAYLSKYVKKHLGLTFLEYLNNVRLFHAVDELIYTNKNITRIALDNGFPTSAAFTKAFRDIHGESPSEYRKKIQNVNQEPEPTPEQEEKNRQRIQEYLKLRENRQEPVVKHFQGCEADAAAYESRDMLWNKAVNVGEAYCILQSAVQNQLREIQRETGMVYARIWNLLTRESCFDEREGYNFRKLDLVLDFLVDIQMKPYIELGYKPELFLYTPERCLRQEEREDGIYPYDTFCEIIRTLCMHLVNRYGAAEVESWYFEFWNDPQLQMTGEGGEYYRYFEVIYRTFKQILPEVRVGGAGLILGYETPVARDIFKIWKQRACRPDFISFCSFQYIALVESGMRYGRKSIDGHYMKNQVAILREMMEEVDFQVPEIHIDEWNFTISNRNILNDSCEQGAYIMKTCMEMEGCVDFMAYWHGLDIYSEYYDSGSILNGDSGMISRDGIKKPSFYAFQFLGRLQQYVMAKDDNSMVTTNGRGRYVIASHNYKKLSSRYVFTEEDEIQIGDLEQFLEDMEPLELRFSLKNMKNGNYLVKIYYVNQDNGNAQELWRKLEFAKGLAKDEIEYLKKRAVPTMEMKTVEVTDGVLELESVLLAQEIRLLDIQYQYRM